MADDLVHLVWVGGCLKKARGSECVEICTFWTAIAFLGVKDNVSEIGRDDVREE